MKNNDIILLEQAYNSIYSKENNTFLCESGYSEAWELIGHKISEVREIAKTIFNLGNYNPQDVKVDDFCIYLGAYIDKLPTTALSWEKIPTLLEMDQKYIKLMQDIQDKPNTRELYIQTMTKRDEDGPRPEGKLSNGVLYDTVKANKMEPPVLIHISSGLYAVGGRTRLYAALASQTNINVIILTQQNLAKSNLKFMNS